MAEEENTKTIDQSQKVSLKEKISFALCNLGNIPLMTLLNTYFLIFYTDVVGLDAAALATLFLISKVVDAISDPLTGFLLDHVKPTKHGKFRPLLIIGTIICCINYVLLWFGAAWSPVYKYVIVYVTYLLLGFTFDIMDISLNSLLPVMTTDNEERNSLSTIKGIAYTVGALIISAVAPYIVAESTLENYYILIFLFVAVTLVFSIVGALGVKERVKFTDSEGEQDNYSIKDLFKFLFMQPVIVYFLSNLLGTVASNVYSGSSTYFYTYVMGDLTISSTISIIVTVAEFPAMILTPIFADKIGKKKTYGIGLALQGLSMLLRLISPTSLALNYVCGAITGFGSAMVMTLGYGIQADNTTYVQYKTGKHAEGAISSLSSLITKVAQGIGGAIPGYVLAWTGYVANAEVQSASAIAGIDACFLVIPAILNIAGGIVIWAFYNISKKDVNEMSATIAERDAETGNA